MWHWKCHRDDLVAIGLKIRIPRIVKHADKLRRFLKIHLCEEQYSTEQMSDST